MLCLSKSIPFPFIQFTKLVSSEATPLAFKTFGSFARQLAGVSPSFTASAGREAARPSLGPPKCAQNVEPQSLAELSRAF